MKRLSVWLDDAQNESIIELSGGEGTARSAWVRAAIDTAIDAARHPARITSAPAQSTLEDHDVLQCVADVDDLREQIAGLEATIETLTSERLVLEQDRKEAVIRASDADKEIMSLGRLLDERAGEISWLRAECAKLNDKLTPATLPERAGQTWWKFWKK